MPHPSPPSYRSDSVQLGNPQEKVRHSIESCGLSYKGRFDSFTLKHRILIIKMTAVLGRAPPYLSPVNPKAAFGRMDCYLPLSSAEESMKAFVSRITGEHVLRDPARCPRSGCGSELHCFL